MGWIANALVILSHILIGQKKKSGFLFSLAGNTIYIVLAIQREQTDFLVLCLIFTGVATYNYFKWDKDDIRIKQLQDLRPKGVL